MFYSFEVLVKKNGQFALIWQYLHNKRKNAKSMRELLEIDVEQSCKDLAVYIPSGKFSSTEMKRKMSLYLLAQLSHGIVLVHLLQITTFVDDLQEFAKSLLRVQPAEPRLKRNRSTAVGNGDEEGGIAKKRRTSTKPTVPIVLDLSEPRAYMKEPSQPPFVTDPLLDMDIDDNFEVKEGQPGALLDWDMEGAQPRIRVSMATIGMRSDKPCPRASVAELDYYASPEGPRRATGHFDLSGLGMMEGIEQPQEIRHDLLSPRLAQLSERLAAQRALPPALIGGEENEEDGDEIALEPLPAKTTPARAKIRRAPVVTYRDKKTTLTEADVQKKISKESRLIRSMERVESEVEKVHRTTRLADITSAFPRYLTQTSLNGLLSLFKSVTDKIKERPLAFHQAGQLDYDDLRCKRRLEYELISWNSEGIYDAYTPGVPTQQDQEQQNGQRVHAHSISPSVILPPVKKRASRVQSFTESPHAIHDLSHAPARVSSVEPARRDVPTPVPLADESAVGGMFPPLADDGFGELQIQAGSPPLRARLSTQQMEEEIYSDASRLLEHITEAASRSRRGVTKFDDVADQNRGERARSFFALLTLLKRQEIRVKQPEPYGTIFIKCRRPSEGRASTAGAASDGGDAGSN